MGGGGNDDVLTPYMKKYTDIKLASLCEPRRLSDKQGIIT